MSNKRAVARQLKQKKKQQKQIAVIIFGVIVLAIIGVFSVYGYAQYSKSYIMVYEGKKVDMRDFQFAMLASQGNGDVKDSAFNLLVDYLTLEKHARDEGITLTETEATNLLSTATQMKSLYGQMGMDFSFIPDARMAEILARDSYYTHLLEKHTADYVVDETDFAASLADYKENQKAAYYNIGLKYISTADAATMDEVMANLTADNFDEIAAEYSDTYTEENGVATQTLASMYGSSTLPVGLADEILGLEVGGRTSRFTLDSGSNVIFEVTSYEIPDDATVETNYREQYTATKKTEIFEPILAGWIAEANYTKNQRAYDAIAV